MYTQWHTTALCSPTRSTLPHRTQPSPVGMACHHRRRQRLPWRARPHPRRVRDGRRRSCRTAAGAPSGWARTTTSPKQDVAPGASRKLWPLQKGFDRFYGFLGGETNQWYPDLVEDNQFIDQPYLPRGRLSPLQGPGRQRHRDDQGPEGEQPVEALVHVVLPGRQPRPAPLPAGVHRQVQGQVRRRLRSLPRVGAAANDREGHRARGHQLYADQPDAGRPGQPGRHWYARGIRSTPTRRSCSAAWPRSMPASQSTPTRRSGRIIEYLEQTGQLDNTLILYAADNGASGEGTPNGSVNENKFFNGFPDDLAENHEVPRHSGQPRHLRAHPDRLGRLRSPRRSRCSSATRSTRAAPATRWSSRWPKGIKAQGEVRHQYHHSHRHRPDHPGGLRAGNARRSTRASSSTRCRASRCATPLTPSRKARRRRNASTTPCWAPAASGRKVGRPRQSTPPLTDKGHFAGRSVGALSRGCGSLRVDRPGRPVSREAAGDGRGVVRGGQGKPSVLPIDDRSAAGPAHAAAAGR